MLELFAPANARTGDLAAANGIQNASLWRSDAIHRARNLAQLTHSLANLSEHPSRRWLPDTLVVQTRSLARAYEELGAECDQTELVPCVPLLTEIATRLPLIFAIARNLAAVVDTQPVTLVPDMRRALILMCSELIINTLKYGYPDGAGGVIRVSLTNEPAGVRLIVEDDGVGAASAAMAGQGSALLEQLGDIMGASLTRSPGDNSQGYRVSAQIETIAAHPA